MLTILRRIIVFLNLNAQHLLDASQVSIKKLYIAMKETQTTMLQRSIIRNNRAILEALFITWLMLHNRLATKSRLHDWGILSDISCVFLL